MSEWSWEKLELEKSIYMNDIQSLGWTVSSAERRKGAERKQGQGAHTGTNGGLEGGVGLREAIGFVENLS